MSDSNSVFRGTIIVKPAVDLQFGTRAVGDFSVRPNGPGRLVAEAEHEDAHDRFTGRAFLAALEILAWDLLWESGVATEFEPGCGSRSNVLRDGQMLQMMYVHDTISAGGGNPKAGLRSFENFDLLQRIRDHLIDVHLAQKDPTRLAMLSSRAEVLLAVERYVRALLAPSHAMANLYSLVETIENQYGGRHALIQLVPKKELDKITDDKKRAKARRPIA